MGNVETGLLNGILYALRYASQGKWVVLVCKDELLPLCQKLFASALPLGSNFSGRTARLGKTKVSLVSVKWPVPFPKGFSALFLGWESAGEGAGMKPWRMAAGEIISPGSL